MSSIESNVTESRGFPPADAAVKKATISGKRGGGKTFVCELDHVGRNRTGETGPGAL